MSTSITLPCERCRQDTTEWFVVVWQRQHAHGSTVSVDDSDEIARLCLYCGGSVQQRVQVAVDKAIGAAA